MTRVLNATFFFPLRVTSSAVATRMTSIHSIIAAASDRHSNLRPSLCRLNPCSNRALSDQKPHGPLISGFTLDGMDQPYSSSEKLALDVNALIKAPTT